MQKVQHIIGRELSLLSYFYEKRKGHVRQIKKAVSISEHTLLKYLASLEKMKMIRSQEEGNLKIYEINLQSVLIKIFFSYFDFERLEKLEYKRAKAIKNFIEAVKGAKFPYFILLFGSTAKGDYIPKSDIDVIIVYDNVDKSVHEKIEKIKRNIFAETGLNANSIVMKLDEFLKEKQNKQNYALQDALASGYPVFGNQLYYEVMFQ